MQSSTEDRTVFAACRRVLIELDAPGMSKNPRLYLRLTGRPVARPAGRNHVGRAGVLLPRITCDGRRDTRTAEANTGSAVLYKRLA